MCSVDQPRAHARRECEGYRKLANQVFELGKDLFNLWAGRVPYDCAKSCLQALLRRTNGYASDTRMIV